MSRTSRYVSFFSAVAGIALLGYLIHRAGVSTVVQAIRLLGAGFIVLLFLSGIRQCLRATAWQCCVDPVHPQRLLDLFILRLIGESVTDLSPAGPLLGDAVKIWAVSKSIPARCGVTSVVIEQLIYSFGTGLFVSTGALLLLVSTVHKHYLVKAAGVMILLALPPIVLAILVQRSHLARELLLRIRNTTRGQALFARYGQTLRGWEATICEFFQTRRKLFLGVLSIEIAVNVISFGETYLTLWGATSHASFLNAYLVESANRCAQLVASFVPFGLGVDEGTTAATLHSLGRTLSEGISVAAIRKIRSIFWDLVGLGLAARVIITRRARSRNSVSANRGILDTHSDDFVISTTRRANGMIFEPAAAASITISE